jgi:acyl-CoA thioester hydrolase
MRDVYETRVRMAETDAAGHVYHGVYVTWMDEAVSAFFGEPGSDAATLEAADWSYRVARVELDYGAPARYEDRTVGAVRCARLGESSMRFDYRARLREDDGDEADPLVEGRVVRVAVDDDGPVRIPQPFRAAVRETRRDPLEEEAEG